MASSDPRAPLQRACPSCAAPMFTQAFARKPAGTLDLDICFACHAIWFDQFESAQLTPGAVLDLFRLIHERRNDALRPIADVSHCPACRGKLALTYDIQRSNRISYYRCPEGHGRLTTFFQFLREKNFVRSLTAPEIERLKVTVAQVRCSSCGAPVDLARDAQCAYCHAPISILDADAVNKAIAELSGAERRPVTADPASAVDALLAGKRYERQIDRVARGPFTLSAFRVEPRTDWVDLVGEALDIFMNGANR
jgi:hypothetical protein